MNKTYSVNLTETQDLGLSFVAVDPQEWIDNAVSVRCDLAITEIMKIALDKAVETGTQLPVTKEEIVKMAFDKGWVVKLSDVPSQEV